MNSLHKLLGHVAVLLLFVCHFEGVAQEEKKPMTIDQLAWLTGSWQGPLDGGILEETWLSPKSETISALVRYTKKGKTEFVEIIKIQQAADTLELRLQLFDPPMQPRWEKPHVFELLRMESQKITFRGVSEGSHRTLSYELVAPDHFVIRFQTHERSEVEIHLSQVRQ